MRSALSVVAPLLSAVLLGLGLTGWQLPNEWRLPVIVGGIALAAVAGWSAFGPRKPVSPTTEPTGGTERPSSPVQVATQTNSPGAAIYQAAGDQTIIHGSQLLDSGGRPPEIVARSLAILNPVEHLMVSPRAATVRAYVLPIKNMGSTALTGVRVRIASLETLGDRIHIMGIEKYAGAALKERISGQSAPVTIPVGETPTEFSLLTRTSHGVRLACEPDGGEWGLPTKMFADRYHLTLEVQGDFPSVAENHTVIEWWSEPDELGNVNRFEIRRLTPDAQ